MNNVLLFLSILGVLTLVGSGAAWLFLSIKKENKPWFLYLLTLIGFCFSLFAYALEKPKVFIESAYSISFDDEAIANNCSTELTSSTIKNEVGAIRTFRNEKTRAVSTFTAIVFNPGDDDSKYEKETKSFCSDLSGTWKWSNFIHEGYPSYGATCNFIAENGENYSILVAFSQIDKENAIYINTVSLEEIFQSTIEDTSCILKYMSIENKN